MQQEDIPELALREKVIASDIKRKGFQHRVWPFVYMGVGVKEDKVLLVEPVSGGEFLFFELDVSSIASQILESYSENAFETVVAMIGLMRPVLDCFPVKTHAELLRKFMLERANILHGRFVGIMFPFDVEIQILETVEETLFYDQGKTLPYNTRNLLGFDQRMTVHRSESSIANRQLVVNWFLLNKTIFALGKYADEHVTHRCWNSMISDSNMTISSFSPRFVLTGGYLTHVDVVYNLHLPTPALAPEQNTCFARKTLLERLQPEGMYSLVRILTELFHEQERGERVMKTVVGLLSLPLGSDTLIFGDTAWILPDRVYDVVNHCMRFIFKKFFDLRQVSARKYIGDYGQQHLSWDFRGESRINVCLTNDNFLDDADTVFGD